MDIQVQDIRCFGYTLVLIVATLLSSVSVYSKTQQDIDKKTQQDIDKEGARYWVSGNLVNDAMETVNKILCFIITCLDLCQQAITCQWFSI